jgi:hypothetical protein
MAKFSGSDPRRRPLSASEVRRLGDQFRRRFVSAVVLGVTVIVLAAGWTAHWWLDHGN